MDDLEKMKVLVRWKAGRRNKWLLVGLVIFVMALGLHGLFSTAGQVLIDQISLLSLIGMMVVTVGWLVGGIIGAVFLVVWAMEDRN